MAGSHLALLNNFAKESTQLLSEGGFWREAILLAVGKLVHSIGDYEKPMSLVAELCPEQLFNNRDAWLNASLAGEVLEEIGLNRAEGTILGKELTTRALRRLADLLAQATTLSPVERNQAGNALGRLGNPRFNPDYGFLPADPMFGFVEVPKGPFLMGSDPKVDSEAYEWEQPQHKVNLPAFFMARYPVTVAQFRAYVEDSGIEPGDPDCLVSVLNHPVVRVFWHEANGYCEWMTGQLRAWAASDSSEKVNRPQQTFLELVRGGEFQCRLPSEAEWEKSARGKDGRIFPWGNEQDPLKANFYQDAWMGSTSVVGCFPDGASSFGCLDMSGNVDEWTESKWTDSYESEKGQESGRRVLRGGSFAYSSRFVRCAYRCWSGPGDRNYYIGFRILCSPITSDL